MPKRSVSAIAYKDGKFFLAKKKPGGSIGGLWEFPGGKLSEDETHSEALKRELKEEFSIDIEVGKRIATAWFEDKGRRFRVDGYLVDFLTHDIQIRDHTEYGWFSRDEINKMFLAGSDRNLFVEIEKEKL
ncbi:MAG: NUDIX domain-containing protein [Spirochaetales bacterium]|nr:NUDIX domain-containing protein [Spirochaetales bacterium]